MTKILPSALRKLLKLPITLPLQCGFIRRRVAYELRQRWFGDLKFEIPLDEKMACPIAHWDSVHSFSEIFVTNEYGAFLDDLPLPLRWLDLGCHNGYFTLFLAWKNSLAGRSGEWRALLLDADPRMQPLVARTLTRNHLDANAIFKLALITDSGGEKEFALRAGMGSSADLGGEDVQAVCRVPGITPGEILAAFPPPYDLIKIDIEGAENLFLENYSEVMRHASGILLEWHSPDREGTREPGLRALCERNGFAFVRDVRPRRELMVEGKWVSSGVQLYRRPSS